MTQLERDKRLKELNLKCMKCREDSIKQGFFPPNPKSCQSFCPTGREIHNLEDPKWDKLDWNSSKWEGLYRN